MILASHLGRPDGKVVPKLSLEPAGARLSQLLGQDVILADDCVGDGVKKLVADLQRRPGAAPGEPALPHRGGGQRRGLRARAGLALRRLRGRRVRHRAPRARLDGGDGAASCRSAARAFSWRRSSSTCSRCSRARRSPIVAILGGAKVSDKIKVIEQLLGKVDALLIGGAMAYTFLAARGVPVGECRVEKDKLDVARRILDKAAQSRVEVLLPLGSRGGARGRGRACRSRRRGARFPTGMLGLDIGPKTRELYRQHILAREDGVLERADGAVRGRRVRCRARGRWRRPWPRQPPGRAHGGGRRRLRGGHRRDGPRGQGDPRLHRRRRLARVPRRPRAAGREGLDE